MRMPHQFWWKKDGFFKEAPRLRREFDAVYRNPKQASPGRFVWDYWHVPGQYTLLRTPAQRFFSQAVFGRFQNELLKFGRENFGCTGITPPWMSLYVEGCRQQFHGDVPHGPFAFVFSLTPAKRKFQGGETMLFKSSTLNYWTQFTELNGVEEGDLVETIAPDFNRLIVFDPRVPHGVTEVRGTHDPRDARLVIHGWFTDPQPAVDGALTRSKAQQGIERILAAFDSVLPQGSRLHGVISLKMALSASGMVGAVKVLVNTLTLAEGDPVDSGRLQKELVRAVHSVRFPKASGPSRLTLPLVFR